MVDKCDPSLVLPKGVFLEMLSSITPEHWGRCAQVNKKWNQLLNEKLNKCIIHYSEENKIYLSKNIYDLDLKKKNFITVNHPNQILDRIKNFLCKLRANQSGRFECFFPFHDQRYKLFVNLSLYDYIQSDELCKLKCEGAESLKEICFFMKKTEKTSIENAGNCFGKFKQEICDFETATYKHGYEHTQLFFPGLTKKENKKFFKKIHILARIRRYQSTSTTPTIMDKAGLVWLNIMIISGRQRPRSGSMP